MKSVSSVGEQLQIELERLKKLTGLGFELKVLYCPTVKSLLSGEVKNGAIYIYERDSDKALDVLRHEFLDYLVSQAIEPYMKVASYYRAMVNVLVEKLGEEAYSKKEVAVEALKRALAKPTS